MILSLDKFLKMICQCFQQKTLVFFQKEKLSSPGDREVKRRLPLGEVLPDEAQEAGLSSWSEGHAAGAEGRRPGLKGSIGEGSNHSNFSHQSSVKTLSKFCTSDFQTKCSTFR